jgi:prepilin-type N-terminal cleavage/methylation domain-containing protein
MTAPRRRRGFSLIEVMLAAAILLGCVIVLSELAGIGREHAAAAEDLSTAQRLCQNRMAELVSGIGLLAEVDNEEMLEDPAWRCSVHLEPARVPGLVSVKVTVNCEANGKRRAREFSLVRWIRDPAYSPAADENAPTTPDAAAPTGPGGTTP